PRVRREGGAQVRAPRRRDRRGLRGRRRGDPGAQGRGARRDRRRVHLEEPGAPRADGEQRLIDRLLELCLRQPALVILLSVVFEEGIDVYFARQLVNERLAVARGDIPAGYGVPQLGPISSGLGEVYHFEVRGDGRSLMELRTILDWQISPRLRMVPGIVEVN